MKGRESRGHAAFVQNVVGRQWTSPTRLPVREVRHSWDRSLRSFGLDPAVPSQPTVLEHSQLRERQERLGPLLSLARNEMAGLHRQIAGSGFAILLTDAQGTILDSAADPSLQTDFRAAGLWLGALWSEDREGTNGIGTCIAEGRPITIHRDEHFRAKHTGLTCSAAPILDPEGRLLAVLDASSAGCRDTKDSQRHTVALVSMSARMLEKCLFLEAFQKHWVLRFHSRPEYVGLLGEALLAVGGDGRVLAADAAAARALGEDAPARLQGRPVEELLDLSFERLLRQGGASGSVWPVHGVRDGQRFFAMLRWPLPGGTTRAVGSSAGSGRVAVLPRPPSLTLAGLAGSDPRMAYNARCAQRVVDKRVAVLLRGETGSGKEAFARAVHKSGSRADKPFVAVNCAAIPESLIESELFGYRHGAFTGARREGMRGKVLQASGGTLFLDEIGDMPPQLQTRLLRVLEEQEVMPLGSEQPIQVDLHIISATHRDLPSLISEGVFREDLYYRLNGITLTLPPLREREDLPELLRCALAAENDTGSEVAMEEAAFGALQAYDWPGNMRQLRNVLRTALALCDDHLIRLSDLPREVAFPEAPRLSRQVPPPVVHPAAEGAGETGALASAERLALLQELERQRWNVSSTANALGMSRNTLYRKMKKHNIEASRSRSAHQQGCVPGA